MANAKSKGAAAQTASAYAMLLQGQVTDIRQDLELLVTALGAAPEEYQQDYEGLTSCIYATARALTRTVETLCEIERALGDDFPLDEAEAV